MGTHPPASPRVPLVLFQSFCPFKEKAVWCHDQALPAATPQESSRPQVQGATDWWYKWRPKLWTHSQTTGNTHRHTDRGSVGCRGRRGHVSEQGSQHAQRAEVTSPGLGWGAGGGPWERRLNSVLAESSPQWSCLMTTHMPPSRLHPTSSPWDPVAQCRAGWLWAWAERGACEQRWYRPAWTSSAPFRALPGLRSWLWIDCSYQRGCQMAPLPHQLTHTQRELTRLYSKIILGNGWRSWRALNWKMRINVTNIIPPFNFNILNTYFQLEKVLINGLYWPHFPK